MADPYIKGLSGSVSRVMAYQYLVVHPKDKVEKENTCGVEYEIHNCKLKHIGETDRKFNTIVSEHQKDAKLVL